MNITRRLKISGRVHGVYFRESMRLRAKDLKVTGWVRNRADGTVEAMVQGEVDAVERMIEWARRGPDAATVASVEVEFVEGETRYADFDKKPSA